MNVPFFDASALHASIQSQIDDAIARVVRSQRFVLGPEVEAFEAEIAAYCGVEHAVGLSSGTDALLVALLALGVGSGDEVITTPYTFVATVESIVRTGAAPVLVDIEPDTFAIDPARIEAAITTRTKVILPVHPFGHLAAMAPIVAIAEKYGLAVIEDAAQAIGAEQGGRRAGSFGTIGCFSFYPTKNLGAFGDGGLVVTSDPELALRMRRLRNHGQSEKYASHLLGGNFRLDALQAAILRAKLPHLEGWTERRRENADRYRALFAERGIAATLPIERPGHRHVHNQFVVRLRARDAVRAALAERGVGTEIYYPRPMHRQPCFAGRFPDSFPESDRAAAESLALPIHPHVGAGAQRAVVDAIAAASR